MKRKLCSVLLALCMVLTLLPVSAMAEGGTDTQTDSSVASAETAGGTKYYDTLHDAVLNVKEGGTVTLLKSTEGSGIGTYETATGADTDKDVNGQVRIPSKSFTIDFGGNTYSLNTPAVGSKTYETQGFHFEWAGADKAIPNITLKNGTVNVAATHSINMKLLIQNYCNLTLDAITVDGTNLEKAWSSNGTPYTYVSSNCNGTVTIRNSKIISKDPLTDVAFDVDGCRSAYNNNPVNLTVEGDSQISGRIEVTKGNSLTIKGGAFTDLATAVAYAADGATIKLAADTTKDVTIPAGATVTLDLNGKTLTNVSGHTITNNGNLTVTGSGTVDNVTHGKGALYNKSGATAILNGGTFTRSQEAGTYEPYGDNGNSWYTIQNDGTMTINAGTTVTTRLMGDGKAVGGYSSLIRNGGNAGTAPTLLINGGHFNGGINTVKNDEGGTLTIKGGDFSNTTQYVIMNWNIADIYDGTFEAQSAASAVLFSSSWNGSAGTLNFHGGNVKTTSASQKAIRDYWDKNNKGNVAVSGGIFTVNPTAYVADTHIARKDGDAQYTVVAKANLTSGVYTSDPSSALAPGYVSYKNSDDTYTVYYPVPVTPGNNNNSSSTTTKNPDGSTTTTTTDKTTGTVTETTKNPDGSTTTVETKKDGSVTETNKTAGGSVGTVKSDANGNSEISASISAADVSAAAKKNEPVAAPVSVAPAASPAAAPVIKLSVPASAGEVSVVIPVTNAQQGTVAIKVNPDGTEEIIKTSVVTKDGVVLGVKGSTQIKIVNNDKDFSDTVGHWAESDVDFVSARELFTGTAPQTFSPESATTRGMVVTVLARLAGESTDGGANWYDKGCAWAVTNGVSDGTDPNGTVTREQLAAMLYRYFGSPAVSGSLSFADASSVSEYAHDAMQWCVNNGIINGMDGLLNPQGQATRAQVSAMFARYIRLAATK